MPHKNTKRWASAPRAGRLENFCLRQSSQLQAASRSHRSALDEGRLPPRLPLQRKFQKPQSAHCAPGDMLRAPVHTFGAEPSPPPHPSQVSNSAPQLQQSLSILPFESKASPSSTLHSLGAGAACWPAPQLTQTTSACHSCPQIHTLRANCP